MTEGVVWEEIYRRQGAAGQTAEEEGRGAKGEGIISPRSQHRRPEKLDVERLPASWLILCPITHIVTFGKHGGNISSGHSISNKFLGSLSLSLR